MENGGDSHHMGTKKQPLPNTKGGVHHRHRAQSIIQFQSLDQLEDEVTQGFYETTPPRKGSRKRVIIMEILYGIYWWACFNKLSSLLYKNSSLLLWQQLTIITALLIFVIVFGCVGVFRRLCSAPFGLLSLRMTSLILLLSEMFQEPIWGVVLGSLGGGACILTIFSGLWNMSLLDRYRKLHCHLLGFISLQIIHFNFPNTFSLLPTSSFHWATLTLLFLSPIATLVTFVQDYRTPLVTRDDLSSKKVTHLDGSIEWVWLGAGFGCHLYIARSIFGASGLLINWMEFHSSFPIKVLLIAVLCVGVLLGNEKNLPLITSPQWLIMGLLSCIGFVYYLSSAAIFGAIMTFFHLMSIWPQLYYRLSEATPSIVYPVAIATYLITLMASQASVGGVGFHGYGIISSMVIGWYSLKRWLPLGVKLGKIKAEVIAQNTISTNNNTKRRPSYTMMVGQMIRRLSTVSEEGEGEEGEGKDGETTIHQRRLQELFSEQEMEMKHFEAKKLRKIMVGLMVLALLSSAAAYG